MLPATARAFARAVVMPNLKPPVTTVASAAAYRDRIRAARPAGSDFEPLMTLYLTDATSPAEIDRAADSGFVVGVKCYPAGSTTHSDAGVTSLARCEAAVARMEERDLVLQLHGEATGDDVDPYDRESIFIERELAPLVARHPRLRIVLEHVTTRAGARIRARGRAARRGDADAAAPLAESRRDVPRRPAPAPLLPAGPEARAGPRGRCLRPRPPRTRASSSAPTARRTRRAPRNPPAAARASTRRRSRSSSMRAPSSRRADSNASRLSPASAAPISTGFRAIAARSPSNAVPRLSRPRCRSGRPRSCRCARAKRSSGGWWMGPFRERGRSAHA